MRAYLSLILVLFSLTGTSQELLISEFTPDGRRSTLELFNPSLDSIFLDGYSIRNSNNGGPFPANITDSKYFSLDGYSLPPLGTLVFANIEAPDEVKEMADVVLTDDVSITGDYILHFFSDDAIGLFKDDILIDIIGKEAVRQVWDVAGVIDVTDHASNGSKTMIRKPDVSQGNPDWDMSRGYVASMNVTFADSSEWNIEDKTYQTLGHHFYNVQDQSIIYIEYKGLPYMRETDEISFGTVSVNLSKTEELIIKNMGDINLEINQVVSSDPMITASISSVEIEPMGQIPLQITFAPEEALSMDATLTITSNSFTDSSFIINMNGKGTDLLQDDTIFFYISPEGDDSNTGSSSNDPLLSVDEALQRIIAMDRPWRAQLPQIASPTTNPIIGTPDDYREKLLAHRNNLTTPVYIYLMPGYHFLQSSIMIDQQTGGNIHFEGVWADGGYSAVKSVLETNEKDPLWFDLPVDKVPVVSGGRKIEGWEHTEVNGVSAWVAEIPDVELGNWYFKQLFVNGRRAVRSRFPKEGFFRISEILPASNGSADGKTDRVRVRPGDMQLWKNMTDVEMVHFHRWVDERMPVVSFDPATNIADLSYISAYDMNGSHPVHGAGLSAYYCEHVFETMSDPGEWYLDRLEGRLYYIPLEGETPENSEIIAPDQINLFHIRGNASANSYIWNVSFKKIGFMHTGTVIEDHIGTGNGNNYGDPAILFEAARVPAVSACWFGHLGEPAIGFADAVMGGEIGANFFRDLGSGATYIACGTTSYDHTRRSAYNYCHDNDILGYGRFYQGEVAMRHTNNAYLVSEHNTIREGFYNALTLGCAKTAALSFGYKNSIRKNHIHAIGHGVLSDMGGIYPNGYQPYSIIENNLVHDINTRDYTGAAIYLDDNSAHFTVRNNVFYNSNQDLINMKGYSILLENNILAFGSLDLLFRHKGNYDLSPDVLDLGQTPARVSKNIFIQNGGQRMFSSVEENADIQYHIEADSNIYWNYSVPVLMNENQPFEAWKSASGDDLNSIETDPLLVDPLMYDFALTEQSPAHSLGIQDIDISDAGIRKSVWDTEGAVWIDYTRDDEAVDFTPREVSGLHMWLSAKDIKSERISKWTDRTSNKFSLFQPYESIQPMLMENGLNGFPVLRFEGGTWMGSYHKSLEIQGIFGKFDQEDFTVFTLHRSTGDGQVIIGKGNAGDDGNWHIGELQNSFSWASGSAIGGESDEFEIRCYRREGTEFKYYLNGVIDSIAAVDELIDFNRDWEYFYLGRIGGSVPSFLSGDIAEIVIFRGSVNQEDLDHVVNYLRTEWGIEDQSNQIEEDNADYLKIYPNPATDILILENVPVQGELFLTDYTGRTLTGIHTENDNELQLDVSGLKPGIYFIRLKNTDGKSVGYRFMKM